MRSNPSALSAPVRPALQGQRLLTLIHTLLPRAKSLRPSSQTNTVACRCTQAPLNKLVQIRKVIDVEIYLYFSQGEDFFTTSVFISEYTVGSLAPPHYLCTATY